MAYSAICYQFNRKLMKIPIKICEVFSGKLELVLENIINMEPQNKLLSLPVSDSIEVVEFSPFEWSSSLLAYAVSSNIVVGLIKTDDEESASEIKFEILRIIHHGIRVHALSWSPQTSLINVPKCIRFASADSDFKIRIFESDLCSKDETQIIEGHSDYINDIAFEPNNGEQIASVSDDHTCRVWGAHNGSSIACFSLTSPGISVKWHINDKSKLMVGEKKGLIRFYNLISQQPIMSLTCEQTPVMNVDWSPSNSLKIGCITAQNLYLWDISHSSLPSLERQAHLNCGRYFKFCPSNDNMFATLGEHSKTLKVFHANMKQILLSKTVPSKISGYSWHHRLPFLAVALDRCLEIYSLEVI